MGSDPNLVSYLLSKLSTTFKIGDLGEPGFFLGIEIVKCSDGILLSQQRYMLDILKRAVNQLCQHMHAPTITHWEQVKRVLRGLADVCAEVIWVISLLREIVVTRISVLKLWCDNLGATYLCVNPIFHARTKHVEIDYHFVRDGIAKGEIQVNFISTKDQLVDIFTKALVGLRFSFLRDKLQVTPVPCARVGLLGLYVFESGYDSQS
ncbi:PREDICTED: uncharacterized protein LOC109154683 [Ipomoea nil]|uniref:uncharacterized protein LOC109154683 n=1 Tax=Ipomoea nil TaxID=35883 RepID=UPI000901A54A|nr:PREDICTED: uncharacterized protein LOC109154683 [Ipomoea nil]